MKIYSDFPVRRALQITADVLALVVISFGIWLGAAIAAAIAVLAQVGRQLHSAGLGFQDAMTDAAEVLGRLPVVGESARVPFDAASGTGGAIAEAGGSTESVILTLAAIIGVVVAVVVIGIVLWVWLRRRIRFARRATEAVRLAGLPGGEEVLALRALVDGSAAELSAVGPRPLTAWRAGEAEAAAALATIALRHAGVRPAIGAAR